MSTGTAGTQASDGLCRGACEAIGDFFFERLFFRSGTRLLPQVFNVFELGRIIDVTLAGAAEEIASELRRTNEALHSKLQPVTFELELLLRRPKQAYLHAKGRSCYANGT